ncbi:hypothetical protein AMQ83_05730 [Paenibacillus riograndensis]|nr:hypothetical protein AMQ83_05730 [Paenibacillus riograndensis]
MNNGCGKLDKIEVNSKFSDLIKSVDLKPFKNIDSIRERLVAVGERITDRPSERPSLMFHNQLMFHNKKILKTLIQ